MRDRCVRTVQCARDSSEMYQLSEKNYFRISPLIQKQTQYCAQVGLINERKRKSPQTKLIHKNFSWFPTHLIHRPGFQFFSLSDIAAKCTQATPSLSIFLANFRW